MAETESEEEKEITLTHEDGSTSIVKGRLVQTDHGVTDKDGNPKISAHLHLNLAEAAGPAPGVVDTPGEAE